MLPWLVWNLNYKLFWPQSCRDPSNLSLPSAESKRYRRVVHARLFDFTLNATHLNFRDSYSTNSLTSGKTKTKQLAKANSQNSASALRTRALSIPVNCLRQNFEFRDNMRWGWGQGTTKSLAYPEPQNYSFPFVQPKLVLTYSVAEVSLGLSSVSTKVGYY